MYWQARQLLLLIVTLCIICSVTTPIAAQISDRASSGINTETISTRLTGFSVPFRVDANDPSFVEVQLFVSRDQGKNWQLYDRRETSEKEFTFKSDGDGEYWFALRTLDRNRRLLPDGQIVDPELRVIVDTVQPKLEFQANSDAAGRVVCHWRAEDENIDPTSVRIFYQPADDLREKAEWIPVAAKVNKSVASSIYSDQLAWWPRKPSRRLNLRFEIADAAGNVVSAERQVLVQHVAQLHRNLSTAYPGQHPAKQESVKTIQPDNVVVCNDGVCQIMKPQDAQADEPEMKETQSEAEIFGHMRPSSTPKEQRYPFVQVGSCAEYVDPPAPELVPHTAPANERGLQNVDAAVVQRIHNNTWQQGTNKAIAAERQPIESLQSKNGQPNSIRWESKQQRWSAKRQTQQGSTLIQNRYVRPDVESNETQPTPVRSAATPISGPANQNRSPSQLAPNQSRGQSFVKQEGDLIISQSTAVGRGRAWNQSSETPAAFGTQNAERWKSKSSSSQKQPRQSLSEPAEHDQIVESTPVPAQTAGFGRQPDDQPSTALPQPPKQLPNGAAQTGEEGQHATRLHPPPLHRTPLHRASAGLSNIPDGAAKLIINTFRFRLNYDVQAIDPSGVGRVVLWMTRDGGKSWKSWATDPDNQSPFPVEVQEEGTYGFSVVIHSRDGLTGKAPSSGDAPDVWIHVDTTLPQVQITSAPYGRGSEAGKLIINWQAVDQLLVSYPIRLAYSPSLRGPWTTIAKSLKNTGRYVWKVPSHVPERIFLRIEARDQAGNASAHELVSQIDLSGLSPRARIFSVEPVGNSDSKIRSSY